MFPQVSNIISTLETILTKGEVQSMIVEYEALNVVIRYVHCFFYWLSVQLICLKNTDGIDRTAVNVSLFCFWGG